MTTEQESQRDLPLGEDAAEEVVGGRSVKRQTKKTGHHVTSPKISPAASVGPPPLGLGMGPDPNYPNPDTDTGDPNA